MLSWVGDLAVANALRSPYSAEMSGPFVWAYNVTVGWLGGGELTAFSHRYADIAPCSPLRELNK